LLKVVSVSLGSGERDKTSRTHFMEEEVELSRIGTNGDMQAAIRKIAELDGKVDAIGLGGIDLYLCAGKRKWTIRDAKRMAAAAKTTPVVDGSILKLLHEPRIVRQLAELAGKDGGPRALSGARVLVTSGVDRWGMAESLAAYAGEIVFGDLIFALGIPIQITTLRQLYGLACVIAPIVTQLPFQWIYPTGDKQKQHKPRHSEYFIWADWICGDYHYIKRNLPPRLDGKVVLTNTTTEADQEDLRARGLGWLITTTPVLDGRSFGMNVLEGCIAALIRRNGEELTTQNYEVYLNKLNLQPTIMQLN
jgi:hypothetical protein